MPSGTLTRKIARHPSPAIRRPPSEGPSAVPVADIVPSSPMARPVSAFGTVSPTSATVRAIRMAAPRPCAARAATSSQSVGARPHRAEASVNREAPASISRRRPVRSPRRPTLTIEVVTARRYARTIHWTSWKEALNVRARVGKATLAMLVPSEDSSMESERLASAHDPEAAFSPSPAIDSTWAAGTGFDMGSSLGRYLTWRKTQRLHFIRAFDAMSSSVARWEHVDARPQPARHARRTARGRQRRGRRPTVAAQPVGDEPGVGAPAGDDGRSAPGQGRTWSGADTPGARTPRAGRRGSCRTPRRCFALPRARPRTAGPNVHAADQRRLRGELRAGPHRARRRGGVRRAAALRARN